jgi:hypothetical protein
VKQRALKLLVSFKGYKTACYTALINKLRQDQSYILIVIMCTKLYKKFIYGQKNIEYLLFKMILNKIINCLASFDVIHK